VDVVEVEDDGDEMEYLPSGRTTGGGSAIPGREGAVVHKGGEPELDESVAVIEGRVDPAEWKLELERVGPKLKITLAADTKDWRSHLEQAHSHKKEIESLLPESRSQLDRVRDDVGTELEKIGTRERFLNNQFDALIMEYRLVRERFTEVQVRCSTV
jgi:estrogen-related receptor beta like 1